MRLEHYKNSQWQLAWETEDLALALEWARNNNVPSRIVRENGTCIYYF